MQIKQTNAREAHTYTSSLSLSFSLPKRGDPNAKRTEKHKDKVQGKTQYKTTRSKNHKASQSKNNNRANALEQSVA